MKYEGGGKAEGARIDRGKTSDEVDKLERGADPSPGSNRTVNGNPIQFYDAENAPGEHDHVPGTIISISEKGIIIAAEGGTLTVGRVKPSGEGKLAAEKWAVDNGIEAGHRFGA